MHSTDKDTRQFHLAIRIMQARHDLRGESSSAVRHMVEQGLAEDIASLGRAFLRVDEHARRARAAKVEAERHYEQGAADAALLYCEAAAHALWAGDEPLAEACRHAYRRIRTLEDME